jgi:regulator of protease activity HflC (stomatin/prohibitin superfamily)
MQNYRSNDSLDKPFFTRNVIIGISMIGVIVISGFAIYPKYRVWSAQMAGEAEFAQAEQNRRVAVLEAEAKLDSAKSLALAEVERAKGVAEANRIIGESLKDNDGYLQYLWIQNLENGNNAVVYVPTEAGLPILEAGRDRNPNNKH